MSEKKKLAALLELSLAASCVVNPEELTTVALREMIRILNAERAFFFRADEKGLLTFTTGRNQEGSSLAEPKGYSRTVVEKVRAESRGLVVSGTEEGAALGSQSAVLFGLRSIMAAPMLIRGVLVGVVYLDSRMARGVFTPDDVETLTALANHIAVSFETVRAQLLDRERARLEQELALTGAVQTLLLPQKADLCGKGWSLAAHYESAAQSGGDWWWADAAEGKCLRILMGDVTGHGPGSAMVTALISGSYRTCNRPLRMGAQGGDADT